MRAELATRVPDMHGMCRYKFQYCQYNKAAHYLGIWRPSPSSTYPG
jgi:hypothetical protein